MRKASSHQFIGTIGERIAQGKVPENQKQQVIAWAKEVVKRMGANVPKRKRDRFNTACVAFDESTGQLYFGRNGGIDRFGPNVHPKIRKLLPRKSLTKVPITWNCAETDALNNALHAGASLRNLHIYTIYTFPRLFGSDKPSCKNCAYAYKGKIRQNNTNWDDEGEQK